MAKLITFIGLCGVAWAGFVCSNIIRDSSAMNAVYRAGLAPPEVIAKKMPKSGCCLCNKVKCSCKSCDKSA